MLRSVDVYSTSACMWECQTFDLESKSIWQGKWDRCFNVQLAEGGCCCAGRQTYVIDKDGKCALSFNDMLNSTQHTDEALSCTMKL